MVSSLFYVALVILIGIHVIEDCLELYMNITEREGHFLLYFLPTLALTADFQLSVMLLCFFICLCKRPGPATQDQGEQRMPPLPNE